MFGRNFRKLERKSARKAEEEEDRRKISIYFGRLRNRNRRVMKLKQAIKKYLRYAKYALLAIAYMMLMEVLGWIFTSQGSWALQGGSAPFALIFYLVWTALFAALAVSLGLVLLRTKGQGIVPALHFLNGAACALYPYLYFERLNLFSALNLCLWLFLFSFYLFKKTLEIEPPAAYLLLPYIIWLGVAVILSYQVVLLN